MKIFEYNKDSLPKETCISIGMFDGVHIGHLDILRTLRKTSHRLNCSSAVMTFDRNPAQFFNSPKPSERLISLERRIELIQDQNIDFLILVHFNQDFAAITADDFIERILQDMLNVNAVISGPNARFGARGQGDVDLLKENGLPNFEVHIVPFAEYKDETISSSRIRKEIASGNLTDAAAMLGRPAAVSGTVVRGHAVGRTLGVPTANIQPDHDVLPPSGIYACTVEENNRCLKAVSCIGYRPTFQYDRDSIPVIETHLLDFNGDLYGRKIRVSFHQKLREEKKFDSTQDLKEAMKDDIRRVAEMDMEKTTNG